MDEKYCIICKRCGLKTINDVNQNYCTRCKKKGLLFSAYSKPLKIDNTSPNLYRYRDWLPIYSEFPGLSSLPGCYKSQNLAHALGLENLWILFSGYWPEKGAFLESGSFKEFEAIGVLSRLRERTDKVMLLSSAGNMGLSTLFISQKLGIPAIVVAPESACSNFLTPLEENDAPVFLISLKQSVYKDCMAFVSKLDQKLPQIICEGGVYNIARRDFLGIPVLHAVSTMKDIPDHYFQAVGSGTGAIAAWEAACRLSGLNGFSCKSMRLHLAQNKPFTPIVCLWEDLPQNDEFKAEQVLSGVLTNPDPPYRVTGGVFDALTATRGHTYGVDNNEIITAKFEFETLEGIDIQYPSAACVAALKQAIKKNRIAASDSILLHITGGGLTHLKKQKKLYPYKPALTIQKTEIEIAARGISGFLADIKHQRISKEKNDSRRTSGYPDYETKQN
ncbi:MAG: cysteate synthase [Desulfobacterales bacterium RIFOXYA12_FULL_46_15]|nr:MAG: cysteate synthase [Desulfobacula sp. GWF2_41_7]OGR26049.1 MAG: cysteate synthase [Desulfobacterales bacterium RIFOXYA12_FULL_46_15]